MIIPDGIQIFDNVLEYAPAHTMYDLAANSFYKIKGWRDTRFFEVKNFDCVHSEWSEEDLANSNFISHISKNDKICKFIDDRPPVNVMINLAHPGDTYYHHSHTGQDVLLYYVNMLWDREWGGETLFYTRDAKEIDYACEFVPSRTVCFDGDIPHTIRPATYIAPKYRMTMSIVFSKREINGSTGNTRGV